MKRRSNLIANRGFLLIAILLFVLSGTAWSYDITDPFSIDGWVGSVRLTAEF